MSSPISEKFKKWRLVLGIFAILASIAAFIAPRIFEIALAEVVAVFILASCVPLLGMVVHPKNAKQRGWALFGLIVSIVIGLWMVFHPVGGAVSIAALLTIYFILYGLFKMVMAFKIDSIPDRSIAIVAGAMSIVCGIVLGKFFEGVTVEHTGIATGMAFLLIGILWVRMSIASR